MRPTWVPYTTRSDGERWPRADGTREGPGRTEEAPETRRLVLGTRARAAGAAERYLLSTLIEMAFGFASSRLGMVRCRTPNRYTALMRSGSTLVGRVNERSNAP